MSTERPPFPLIWDSTMVAAAKACERKCMLSYFHHWASKRPNVHLHAGGSYARALEITRRCFFEQGMSASDSMTAGARALIHAYGDFIPADGDTKTLPRMLGALAYYFEVWPLAGEYFIPAFKADGERMVEFTFAEPLDDVIHPVSGEPIIYAGRTDQIVQHTQTGQLFIHDDKTTSSLGDSWAKQWGLRGQFTGYCFAARKVGINVQGVVVRGLGILKTKFSHAEAGPLARPQWMVDEWYASTCAVINRMAEAWKIGDYAADFSESCNAYGGCGFTEVCLTSPQFRDEYVAAMYERREWKPLEKHDN